MRILLVDDEPKLLEGFQRLLRMDRPGWEVTLAESGARALAILADQRFDIVVTEILMAGMDGGALLREVQRTQPATIRVALSGESRVDIMEKSEGNFHRFLSKPMDPETLLGILEELSLAEGDASERKAREFVAGLAGIPSLPHIYEEIRALLSQEDVSMAALVSLVQTDMGIASKLLKLVNSAYFSLERKVTDLGRAINMLGLETVKTVVLVRGVMHALKTLHPGGLDLDRLWKHSQAVGNGARNIAQGEGQGPSVMEEAYSLGLLHDIGRVVLALDARVDYGRVLAQAEEADPKVVMLEKELFGTDHAHVGAHVLGLWGLPPEFCGRIREHHAPLPSPGGFAMGLALHAADGWTGNLEDPFRDGRVDESILAQGDASRPARWASFIALGAAG